MGKSFFLPVMASICCAIVFAFAMSLPAQEEKKPNKEDQTGSSSGTTAPPNAATGGRSSGQTQNSGQAPEDVKLMTPDEIRSAIKVFERWRDTIRNPKLAGCHAKEGKAYFEHLESIFATSIKTLQEHEKIRKKTWGKYVREELGPETLDLMHYTSMQYVLKAKQENNGQEPQGTMADALRRQGIDPWVRFEKIAATSRPKPFELGVTLHLMEKVDGEFREVTEQIRFFGGPYHVEARYEEEPGEASVAIRLSALEDGDELSVTAKPTEDPTVYRSEEFFIYYPEENQGRPGFEAVSP